MIPHAQIRSALRKIWLWSPVRREALKRAKVGGVAKTWRCEWCKLWTNEPEVDHILPVGSTPGARGADAAATWDDLIRRMFCSAEGLRVLCRYCHQAKTKQKGEAS